MADIIQQRRDTAARWAQYNPILLEGEVGYVTDNPNQYKIGNGRDRWNNLPLRGYTGTITQDTGDDENAVMSQKAVTDKLSELGSKVNNNSKYTLFTTSYPIEANNIENITFNNIIITIPVAVGRIRLIGTSEGNNTTAIIQTVYEDDTFKNDRLGVVSSEFNYDINLEEHIVNNELLTIKKILFIFQSTGISSININRIEGSYNVINSLRIGNAKPAINYVDKHIGFDYTSSSDFEFLNYTNRIMNGDGTTRQFNGYTTTNYIPINKNFRFIKWSGMYSLDATKTFCGVALFNDEKNLLNVFGSNGEVNLNDYPTAKYIKYCFPSDNINSLYIIGDNVDTSSIINIADSKMYGTDNITGGTKFSVNDKYSLITTKNSESENDGILSEIAVYVSEPGKIRMGVGLLDQRNLAVISTYFDIEAPNKAHNRINVEHMMIPIAKGEQVFSYVGYYDPMLYFRVGQDDSDIENEMLYGTNTADAPIVRLPTEYGGRVNLAYNIKIVDSPFASKSEVKQLSSQIAIQNESLAKVGFVYDNEGNPYRIKVINGGLYPVSLNYKKAVALGNSLTAHGLAENIGYYADGWPMAASVEETGWVYMFEQVLKSKVKTAELKPHSIYDWEIDYLNVDLSVLLDEALTPDVDLIIFRAGENNSNVTSVDEYFEGIDRLLRYIINKCPAATIVMTSLFWHNAIKESAIVRAANKYGLTYIYTENVGKQKCRIGDYTKGSDGLLHKIVNNGVANHMNDIGFSQWVTILSNSLGYEFKSNLRNVVVKDDNSIGYACFDKWAVGGVFNITTNATTVIASHSGGQINVTNHNDGVFTFIMPNENVNITLVP